MTGKLLNFYINLVLKQPWLVLVCIFALFLALGWNIQYFRMDASADSLVIEGDQDLEFSRVTNDRYGTRDFVFVTFSPDQELFTPASLDTLKSLNTELLEIPGVADIDSIFDVPLFKVAGVSLSELGDNIITLESPAVDLAAARLDLMSSEAYRNVLLSADGKTTAMLVNFSEDTARENLLAQRTELRDKRRVEGLTAEERKQLADVEQGYTEATAEDARKLHQDITDIRTILNRYRDHATIYLGGVPMIADDLISFVRNDLITFGSAILLFIIVSLAYLFRKIRYVLIPLICGTTISVSVIGLLGLMDWPVTVISSNFISLLLIISISLTVHLIVRYRELEADAIGDSHHERIRLTLQSMLKPCAYTSLTTIVAFGSLVLSDIPPIIDFGWMMVMGICIAFVMTFLIFPSILGLLPPNPSKTGNKTIDITPGLASFTQANGKLVLSIAAVIFILSVIGVSRLKVENSFIDYFDDSTEIYQGMVAIDRDMGGTTPLDVVIDMSRPNPFGESASDGESEDAFFDEGFYDEFDEFDEGGEGDEDAYWFTSDKMQEIIDIHKYLESLPETGKVLSLATLLEIAYELNEGKPLNSIELGVLYNRIPQDYKDALLQPYVSVPDDQIRFSIRVLETSPGLVREDLLEQIRSGLKERFGLEDEQIHLTGMLVLYNNMLQSLFDSQIKTLGVVFLMIMGMILVLFRSAKLAAIGIIPNILAALAVLGLMGWLGIPLDMMTITIAAIALGIGVDNTIHYLHRFKSRFPEFNDYTQTMKYCHGSIGKAMYYTGFTIVAGFSILVLSNFIPTIYFGLLTSLAMCLALAGALTLLPQLMIVFKPLGKGQEK